MFFWYNNGTGELNTIPSKIFGMDFVIEIDGLKYGMVYSAFLRSD